ncbi:hypothetical protein [Ornithinimicrobium avium]|uniref:DUF559 domain-containing protein n=1 Tax=Ornithinimicrobium avium TaxID=2283195 RepID=A0A345NM99_9MICO|nr:hypothetical protein [Ornithinimicrobium avium]AXH96157.1 hypothetical protein DV701_08450 [Ornithinimicrobium avium]
MSVEGIIKVFEAQGGAASRRQLKEAGYPRRSIEAMIRRRVLVAVRKDALVLGTALAGATPWARRALEARAVGLSLAPTVPPARAGTPSTPGSGQDAAGPAYALSHESSLMILDLPYFGEDGLIHLVRTDGRRGRRDGTIWVHRPQDPDWVVDVDGLRVIRPVLAALQVAATHGPEAGLVALDGVLHQAQVRDLESTGRRDGPESAEARRQVTAALALGWGPARPTVTLVVDLADGRSESAGESRTRWLLRTLGFGPMTPQFPVQEGRDLVGRADLKLDRWAVLVEFDGTGKYDEDGALVAEKDREDRLRRLGYEVVRVRWADLARPHLVRRRILGAIGRAEARAAAMA